ncbi:MAG: hypothetical protein ACU0DW_08250 [Shimia sp.]
MRSNVVPLTVDVAPEDRKVLCVGDVADWATRELPNNGAGCVFAAFDDINASLIDEIAPDVIVSELWAPGHDAADMATLLHELKYEGRYLALSPPLPRPAIVTKEVHCAAPNVRFELILTD